MCINISSLRSLASNKIRQDTTTIFTSLNDGNGLTHVGALIKLRHPIPNVSFLVRIKSVLYFKSQHRFQ